MFTRAATLERTVLETTNTNLPDMRDRLPARGTVNGRRSACMKGVPCKTKKCAPVLRFLLAMEDYLGLF